MQFVETARRLELHAFSVCTKSPKRYSTLLTNRIFELASTVHEEVRAANNIYPKNKHEAQIRRDHLTNANIALQNLSPKLTLLYDAILQNPEKCPWIDHAMKEFGEYIVDEAQLISKVKKSDNERFKTSRTRKVGTLMYKIMKENTALAVVTTPVWVKMQDNGSFALCEEAEAQGVVVDGTVYHVSGRPEIEGHETVILGEITETAYQREQAAEQEAKQLQMDTALAELSILIASAIPAAE